uniref:Uncharacterized protein n=1 Tax=Anguilla anguilla TaxID=7936 RepID=A0A0E9X9E9_ANGAN
MSCNVQTSSHSHKSLVSQRIKPASTRQPFPPLCSERGAASTQTVVFFFFFFFLLPKDLWANVGLILESYLKDVNA